MQRMTTLQQHRDSLTHILRGIEREGLRIDRDGALATTPHSTLLGSALTHPNITTDYSEALIELITTTHASVDDLLEELTDVHRFATRQFPSESIWMQSMPGHLPADDQIPIATYGKSNSGMLRHVYRRGLAERYGRTMQCIAGLHYNFSLPDSLWQVLDLEGTTETERQSVGYMGLIRNFTRYNWLLMYLFGASPAVPRSFLGDRPNPLRELDHDTLYLPYATSLRMSDLGYQNDAQAGLKMCYNDLSTFIRKMYHAVTQPWPEYQALGTHRDGQWIQLNTNVLQIENEYYSTIRPKRTTARGERPITALMERGIQYVEIRCLDIDPFSAVGISNATCHFMDAFLLFCAVHDSRLFPYDGFCEESQANFTDVVNRGRDPALRLTSNGEDISIPVWGNQLLDQIALYAKELDIAFSTTQYSAAIQEQRHKLDDVSATPSARILQELRDNGLSFADYTQLQSQRLSDELRFGELSAETEQKMRASVKKSLEEQAAIEASDNESFDEYVERYMAALKRPE